MSPERIIRCWKDEQFRNSLSEKEQALLPEHPSGSIELTDVQLGAAVGGVVLTCMAVCLKQTRNCPNELCTENC